MQQYEDEQLQSAIEHLKSICNKSQFVVQEDNTVTWICDTEFYVLYSSLDRRETIRFVNNIRSDKTLPRYRWFIDKDSYMNTIRENTDIVVPEPASATEHHTHTNTNIVLSPSYEFVSKTPDGCIFSIRIKKINNGRIVVYICAQNMHFIPVMLYPCIELCSSLSVVNAGLCEWDAHFFATRCPHMIRLNLCDNPGLTEIRGLPPTLRELCLDDCTSLRHIPTQLPPLYHLVLANTLIEGPLRFDPSVKSRFVYFRWSKALRKRLTVDPRVSNFYHMNGAHEMILYRIRLTILMCRCRSLFRRFLFEVFLRPRIEAQYHPSKMPRLANDCSIEELDEALHTW